jgi:hypothetical protein
MRYEVRCCCEASKLLGWLEWPNAVRVAKFILRTPPAVDARFRRPGARLREDRIQLRLNTIHLDDGRRGVAVKADGIPVETLRRVPGFVDADPDWIDLDELRRRIVIWSRAHDGARPEQLHFRVEQWDRFKLEREALGAIFEPGDVRTVYGIPAELHPTLEQVPHDAAPELWQ